MKYSILTCIFGNYEILRQPWNPDPECEYVCVTDRNDIEDGGLWKIVHLNEILQTIPFTNQWTYVRYHPFDFVSNNVCIYIDGSIQIINGVLVQDVIIKPFVEGEFYYGIIPNLDVVDCDIYQDIDFWESTRNISHLISNKIRNYLKKNGYHVKGMLQSGFLIHKKCKENDIINHTTWELCHLWGYNGCNVDRNNQIDLSYTINKLFYKSPHIFRVSGLMLCSAVFQICPHGTDKIRYNLNGLDESYFCDERLLNHVIRTPELKFPYE